MRRFTIARSVRGACRGLGLVLCLSLLVGTTGADEGSERPAPAAGRYLSLGPDWSASQSGQVRNAGSGLARRAAGTESVRLTLELQPGAGTLTEVLDLAEYLASGELRDVSTVAWVPQSLTGPRVLLAIACREIVLHPDAVLGDIAAGQVISPELRGRIERLAARRTNPQVSPALVTAMLDPSVTLVRIHLHQPADGAATRIVLSDELPVLRAAGIQPQDLQILKPPGTVGTFSGAQAAAEGFLVAHTARNTEELAALFQWEASELTRTMAVGPVQRPALIQVTGEITPQLAAFLNRQIDRAEASAADAIIFEINSPGGLLQESLDLAYRIAGLREQGIRTVAYVERDAVSGAAIISLGCDEIYLHPTGKIGDAGPITLQDGVIHRAPEKIVSYLREVMRELAELKGRPPAVLMAMVDRELDVFPVTHRDTGKTWYLTQAEIDAARGAWIAGPHVPEAAQDLLLFVNGRRAHELQIAEPPVDSLAELRTRLGVPEGLPLTAVQQTWLDDTVFILNTNAVTGLLFFLGVILLFVELHFMIGLAGILAAMCFGVFFWSKFLGGTAGWLEVVLFLLGLACLALEIFVIPGFGVFGLAGGLLVLGSLVMAGSTLSTLDQGVALSQSLATLRTLGLALVAVIGAGIGLSHFLPRIPLLNAMILAPPQSADAAPARSAARRGEGSRLLGRQGITATMLRPAGKVRIDGELLDAVSTAGFIEPGAPVEVAEVASNRLVVRLVQPTAHTES